MGINTLQARLIHVTKSYHEWINTSSILLKGEIGLELRNDSIEIEIASTLETNWAVALRKGGAESHVILTSSVDWFNSLSGERVPTNILDTIEIQYDGEHWDFSSVSELFGHPVDILQTSTGVEIIFIDVRYDSDFVVCDDTILFVEGEENSNEPTGLSAKYNHFTSPNYRMKIGDGNLDYIYLPYFGGASSTVSGAISGGGGSGAAYAGNIYEGHLNEFTGNVETLISSTLTGVTLHKGDIFIVNAPINGKVGDDIHATLDALKADSEIKWQKTAYIYDNTVVEDFKWVALDGNYNAKSVYFDSDILATVDFGKYETPASGNYTISAKGLSLDQVLRTALVEEITTDLKTDPKITLAGNAYVPVNSESQTVSVTITKTDGSYTYGYQSGSTVETSGTGGSFGTTSYSTDGASWTETTTNTVSVETGSATARSTKTVKVKSNFTGAGVPVSNLGNPVQAEQIADGDITSNAHAYVYFYEPLLAVYDLNRLDSADQVEEGRILACTTFEMSGYTATNQYNMTLPKIVNSNSVPWKTAFICVPTSYNKSITSLTTEDSLPYTWNTKTVVINGVSYKVYYVTSTVDSTAQFLINQ